MANRALDEKRAQALHITKRMNHKISRLRTKADVEVAGSQYDVRANPKNIRRYTEKQLDAYLARGSQFLDRGTQFVPDAHRNPIPAAEFKQLNKAQQAVHDKMQAQLDAKRDTPTASGTETIGSRRDKMRADRKLAGNPSVNDPYDPKVNKSTDLSGRKAIKTLLKDAQKKLTKDWDKKELNRQIGEFSKMVNRIGDADLAASVKALTPAQFRSLWNDEGFAAAVSSQYEIVKTTLISEEDKPWHTQVISDAFADARRMVEWAAGLDPETGAAPVEEPAQTKQPKKPRKKK